MTLPTSGVISLADIQTEFGGANPISINEYYAGGTYVASGTSGTNGAVPSSGQISFSQFYGTSSGPVVNFVDSSLSADSILPDNATVTYSINANGTVVETIEASAGTSSNSYNWVTPANGASQFECYASIASGTISSGLTNVWLTASSDQSWSTTRTSSGTTSGVLNFQVRKTGNTTVLDTWTVTLTASAGG